MPFIFPPPGEPPRSHSIDAIPWGTVELEPEVRDWLNRLHKPQRAVAAFHIDRLAEWGPRLTSPHTKQLDHKVRELRFYLDGRAVRVTYWIAKRRRIILVTVFYKTRNRDQREVTRAQRAWATCVNEQHTADDDGGNGNG